MRLRELLVILLSLFSLAAGTLILGARSLCHISQDGRSCLPTPAWTALDTIAVALIAVPVVVLGTWALLESRRASQ